MINFLKAHLYLPDMDIEVSLQVYLCIDEISHLINHCDPP